MSLPTAAALVLLLATTFPPAFAADPGPQDIESLVAEIEQLPKEAFDADPRRWQEVFDLLEQYLATAQAVRAPVAAAAPQKFTLAFRQSAAKLRQGPQDDVASRLLWSSLNGAGAGALNSSGTSSPSIDLAHLAELAAASHPGHGDTAGELWPLLTLSSPGPARLLQRKAELANAAQPNAAALNQAMHDAVTRLQARGEQGCQDLQRMQRQAEAMSRRVSALESLVQRNGSLDMQDPAAAAATLGQLRAELSALQVGQHQQLLDLGARELVAGAAPVDSTPQELGRAALAGELERRVDALHDGDGDAATKALLIAQQELNLAALDALAREALIKAALLRQGRLAQGELMQASAEAARLAGAIDRVAVK